MGDRSSGTDRLRAYLVLAATAGTVVLNWLAATGRIGGNTPGEISARYPTILTPADYAFTIWTLIYAGLAAFSIIQALPSNFVRFRSLRPLYIFSCALNCAWIFFWHGEQILVCFLLILALWAVLLIINNNIRETSSNVEYWAVKAPFGLYFGWVTVAALVNFSVLLVYLRVATPDYPATVLGVVLILLAGALGVVARVRLKNYFYPLAVAWGLAAIAVKQSVHTLIVVAAAVGVVACLIAAASFVVNLPSSTKTFEAD